MTVSVLVIGQIMVVLVAVGDSMLVRRTVVSMDKNVHMLVSVLMIKRVDYNKYRSGNHHGKSEAFTLNFKPTESLLLKVDAEGIQQIDLGFMPKKMNGYQENN